MSSTTPITVTHGADAPALASRTRLPSASLSWPVGSRHRSTDHSNRLRRRRIPRIECAATDERNTQRLEVSGVTTPLMAHGLCSLGMSARSSIVIASVGSPPPTLKGNRVLAPCGRDRRQSLKPLMDARQHTCGGRRLSILVSGTSSRNVTTFSDSKPNGIAKKLLDARA